MTKTAQIANRFREVYLNGKWVVATNIKEQLSDVTWEQATTKIGSLNTIAALAFHLNYYVAGVLNVYKGGSLDIRDKYSFDCPPIESKKDWDKLMNKILADAEEFANVIEQMPDEKLEEVFVLEKYGDYRRSMDVMIEHCFYHLGQIVLIKKLIAQAGGQF